MRDGFEELKGRKGFEPIFNWIKEMPFIGYGFVKDIIDEKTVIVKPVIQETKDLFEQEYTVTLLSFTSSVYEFNAKPCKNDLVLLLATDKYDNEMFDSIESRQEMYKNLDDEQKKQYTETGVVDFRSGVQYSTSSLVGMLFSTVKMCSAVMRTISKDDDSYYDELLSYAKTSRVYKDTLSIECTDAEKELPVTATFGDKRPIDIDVQDNVDLTVGFTKDGNNELKPITNSKKANITFSEKVDLALSLQGKSKLSIGKDLKGKATNGVLDIELGQNVEVNITYDNGIKIKTNKTGDVEVETNGKIKFFGKAGIILKTMFSKLWLPNCVKVCPFGMPHGGMEGGIADLKGSD